MKTCLLIILFALSAHAESETDTDATVLVQCGTNYIVRSTKCEDIPRVRDDIVIEPVEIANYKQVTTVNWSTIWKSATFEIGERVRVSFGNDHKFGIITDLTQDGRSSAYAKIKFEQGIVNAYYSRYYYHVSRLTSAPKTENENTYQENDGASNDVYE